MNRVWDVHATIKRVTPYILWNELGITSMTMNDVAMHSMHFEVPFYCVVVDVLSVAVDTANITMRVEGVIVELKHWTL